MLIGTKKHSLSGMASAASATMLSSPNLGASNLPVRLRPPSKNSSTGYPLRKMLRFAADGIFGFSTVPLQAISRLGFAVSALALLGIVYALVIRIFLPQVAVPGWAFQTIATFFIGGIQLVMLGVLGSYIGRIYVEVLKRPLYTLALVAGAADHGPDAAPVAGARVIERITR